MSKHFMINLAIKLLFAGNICIISKMTNKISVLLFIKWGFVKYDRVGNLVEWYWSEVEFI